MLEDVKQALRITNNAYNKEIEDLIDAAKLELEISGVKRIEEADPLIKRAVKLYCKANFGFDNPDAEGFQRSYEMLKQHLSLSGDYNA